MSDDTTAGDDLETLNTTMADLRAIQERFLWLEDERIGVEHATELSMAMDAVRDATRRVEQLTQEGSWPPEQE